MTTSGAVSATLGILSIVFIAICIIYTLTLIANIMLFEKSGKKPWLGVIPFVDSYIMYSTFWNAKVFWGYIILYAVSFTFANSAAAISLIIGIAMFALNLLLQHRISTAFGKGWGYAIGLALLYPIVGVILFSKNDLTNEAKESIGIK